MVECVVVIGAGGFGRETVDVVRADPNAPELIGVVDDGPSAADLERLARLDVPYLGHIDGWATATGRSVGFIVAIGAPSVRRRLADRLESEGYTAVSVCHPTATIGSDSDVGPGSVICAGAHVSTNVRLGRHAHIGAGAVVGHDTILSGCVSVNPGAIVSGAVVLGADVLVGAGATVLQGLTVGPGALVGAAACVTRDVPDGRVVKGVPAR